jgi:hypothetical protein
MRVTWIELAICGAVRPADLVVRNLRGLVPLSGRLRRDPCSSEYGIRKGRSARRVRRRLRREQQCIAALLSRCNPELLRYPSQTDWPL